MSKEIKLCPFRTYSEVRPARMQGTGDVTITGFMECLKSDCPAWAKKDERIPCTNKYTQREICKRLEKGD